MIYWFTGQPGAGKTTLALALKAALQKMRQTVVHLDGESFRALTGNADYSEAGRIRNIRAAQKLATQLHAEGIWVVASFVSPYRHLREEFKRADPVREVYVHTLAVRGREARFVANYEPPQEAFLDLDTTDLSVEACVERILAAWPLPTQRYVHRGQRPESGQYAMFVGRWQPWHNGHRWLIDQALAEGKRVLICVRDVPTSERNPFTVQQVMERIQLELQPLIAQGRVKVISIPDIDSINFGREAGYSVIEHVPPPDVARISGTDLRGARTISIPR